MTEEEMKHEWKLAMELLEGLRDAALEFSNRASSNIWRHKAMDLVDDLDDTIQRARGNR